MPRRNNRQKGARIPSARIYSSAWGSDGELHPVNRNKKVKWPTETRTLIHPHGRLTRSVLSPQEAKKLKQQLGG